jgi:hypothetical protein
MGERGANFFSALDADDLNGAVGRMTTKFSDTTPGDTPIVLVYGRNP